jgi:hypothetical protein
MADRALGVIRKELATARQRVAALEQALAALGGATQDRKDWRQDD